MFRQGALPWIHYISARAAKKLARFTKPPAKLFPTLTGTISVEQKKYLKLWMGEQSLERIPAGSRQPVGFVNRAVKRFTHAFRVLSLNLLRLYHLFINRFRNTICYNTYAKFQYFIWSSMVQYEKVCRLKRFILSCILSWNGRCHFFKAGCSSTVIRH